MDTTRETAAGMTDIVRSSSALNINLAAKQLERLELVAAAAVAEQYEGTGASDAWSGEIAEPGGALPSDAEVKDKGEGTSRPPSPPSREDTPPEKKKRVVLCPARLKSYTPPFNYGAVIAHQIFRSSFPLERNIDFLRSLEVKTILSLVGTDPCDAYTDYVQLFNVERVRLDIAPNKNGLVSTTVKSICEALLVVLDSSNHPVYIHCNQGKHRTGCLVACLRKVQQWPLDDVLDEYRAYASPKVREGDVAFIRSFQPWMLFKYAKRSGIFGKLAALRHLSVHHLTDIDALVDALLSRASPPQSISSSSVSERSEPSGEGSDAPLEFSYRVADPVWDVKDQSEAAATAPEASVPDNVLAQPMQTDQSAVVVSAAQVSVQEIGDGL